MHNHRPLDIASTIGPVDTPFLPALTRGDRSGTHTKAAAAQAPIGECGRAEHGSGLYLRQDGVPTVDNA